MDRDRQLSVLFAASLLVTVAIYLVLVRRHLSGEPTRALVYAVVGWVPYTLTFYAAARRFSAPAHLPSMRGTDLGTGLFLVSLLVSAALDAGGFAPERVPLAHLLPAVGIYAGLALFGWGVGRRSRAIGDAVDG